MVQQIPKVAQVGGPYEVSVGGVWQGSHGFPPNWDHQKALELLRFEFARSASDKRAWLATWGKRIRITMMKEESGRISLVIATYDSEQEADSAVLELRRVARVGECALQVKRHHKAPPRAKSGKARPGSRGSANDGSDREYGASDGDSSAGDNGSSDDDYEPEPPARRSKGPQGGRRGGRGGGGGRGRGDGGRASGAQGQGRGTGTGGGQRGGRGSGQARLSTDRPANGDPQEETRNGAHAGGGAAAIAVGAAAASPPTEHKSYYISSSPGNAKRQKIEGPKQSLPQPGGLGCNGQKRAGKRQRSSSTGCGREVRASTTRRVTNSSHSNYWSEFVIAT